jgi:iron complex transport system substrate-binding protein
VRIISLLASATEMVAALGCLDDLVGRSHECDYPPEVQKLPVVSTVQINTNTTSADIDAQIKHLALQALSIYAIDVEMLQALQPDVIFTQTQCEVCAVSERDVIRAVQQLTGMQPRIVSLAPHRLEDVWEDVMRVGAALGKSEQASALVKEYRGRLERLREVTSRAQDRPRVAVLEWLDPLMGAGNWMPELVVYAGGAPVFGEVGQHSPWISWEELRAADPDILALAPCGFTLERILQDIPLLQRHPTWGSLQAVQHGRVYAFDGNAYFNRSGPRLVESAELLAKALWSVLPGIEVDDAAWMSVT